MRNLCEFSVANIKYAFLVFINVALNELSHRTPHTYQQYILAVTVMTAKGKKMKHESN